MPVTFSDDELFLIEQLAKTTEELAQLEPKDLDRVAESLVKHMGDMKFNKKLPRSSDLARFIYKTQDYEAIESINKKIQINKQLKKDGLDIVEEEKLSLKEIGRLMKFSDLKTSKNNKDLFSKKLAHINENCNNKAFKELYANIALSHSTLADIKKDIIESKTYKTNDISLENMNKSKVAKGSRPTLFDYDGPLAQMLLSDGYGHAAPLYVKNNPNGKTTETQKSHILGDRQVTSIEVLDILSSDTFRIDPTKLINKSVIPQLEQVYGKEEWQNYIRSTYKILADNLHKSFEDRTTQIANLKAQNNAEFEQVKKLNDQINEIKQSQSNSDAMNSQKITSLHNTEQDLANSQLTRAKKIKLLEANNTINNDTPRLNNPLKWFSPKAIVQGHTKLGHKNDFRALSKEMFNPTEANKKMICSEFGAVTIAASIDQLNRIVAGDLQAAELIDKEQEIFKNPIPKNERINKIHPGRLVHLLKKAGAVEVRNETVDQYVKKNDLTSMKTANIELDLPNKILFLLKNSKDKDDFIDKANKNLAIYLEAYKFDKEVIEQIKENAKKQFAEFHDRKNETGILTSIKKLCKGIAVSLHLREKEKTTKKLSWEILTQVEKIQKQRDSKKPLNEKIDSSPRVWTPAKPTQARKFNKNSNTSRSL